MIVSNNIDVYFIILYNNKVDYYKEYTLLFILQVLQKTCKTCKVVLTCEFGKIFVFNNNMSLFAS